MGGQGLRPLPQQPQVSVTWKRLTSSVPGLEGKLAWTAPTRRALHNPVGHLLPAASGGL